MFLVLNGLYLLGRERSAAARRCACLNYFCSQCLSNRIDILWVTTDVRWQLARPHVDVAFGYSRTPHSPVCDNESFCSISVQLHNFSMFDLSLSKCHIFLKYEKWGFDCSVIDAFMIFILRCFCKKYMHVWKV